MDEESLFRDIHNHLIHQAQEGGKMDTEMKLAERFNVSRYRVRRVLDILADGDHPPCAETRTHRA